MKQFLCLVMLCIVVLLNAQYQEPERYSNDVIDSFSTNAFQKLVEYEQMKKTVTLKSRQVSYFISNPTQFNDLYSNKDFSLNPSNEGVNPYDISAWNDSNIANAQAKIDAALYNDFKKHVLQIVATIPDKGTYLNSIFSSETSKQNELMDESKNVNPLKRARCVNSINYYISEMDNAELEIDKLKNLSLQLVTFASQKSVKPIAKTDPQPVQTKKEEPVVKKQNTTNTSQKSKSNTYTNNFNNSVKEIYFKDYGYINRTVLVLDKKANYSISKSNRSFDVKIKNVASKNARYPRTISSKVIDSYKLSDGSQGTTVTIQTDSYPIVKTTELPGKKFKIVLDIFAMSKPSTTDQYFSFADFYNTVGFRRTALKYYDLWDRSGPSDKNGYYDYGRLLVRRGKNNSARKVLSIVEPRDENYSKAQQLLKKIGTNPVRSTQPKKQNTVASTTPKVTQPKTKVVKPIEFEEIEEDLGLNQEANDLYLSYKNYFTSSKDINLHRYLAGVAAKSVQNYDSAQKALLSIDESSPLIHEMYKEMLEVSEAMGDEENANLYRSLILPEEELNQSKLSGGIPVWMVLVLMLASSGIVFFLLMIYYNRKIRALNEEELFTVNDVAYHEERIKEAYQNKQEEPEPQPEPEPIPEEIVEETLPIEDDPIPEATSLIEEDDLDSNPFDLSKEEGEISLQFDKDSLEKEFQSFVEDNPNEFGDFDFDNPNILAEELTNGEEQELLNAEKEMLFGSGENDLDELGLSNDNRQKMVQKLMNDGWEIEEIAKELQISQREVEIIAKM